LWNNNKRNNGRKNMETEIKKKEQTMMCAENLKINEMRDKKINSQTTRETSGITLIALVVTIVVLLILAGITISLVFGSNGVIQKA
jgi:type II secretory pathway pseudopilin PulG